MAIHQNHPAENIRRVVHPAGALHVVDRAGSNPPVVLMHGFPDDHHVYDRLTPLLRRRTVAFDFRGYGRSDRPARRRFARADRQRDLSAAVEQLGPGQVVLAGHDASGPEAIRWALEHPGRVARLVLLNTYYGHHASLRLPEMIRLLADPALRPLADAMLDDPQQRLWLLGHTARQFGMDAGNTDGVGARSIAAQFFGSPAGPDALTEIRAWTNDLFAALHEHDQRVQAGELATLAVPVSLVFGADDAYLNPGLARHLASLFPQAELHLIENAGHWPQWDQPEAVAAAIEPTLAAGPADG